MRAARREQAELSAPGPGRDKHESAPEPAAIKQLQEEIAPQFYTKIPAPGKGGRLYRAEKKVGYKQID